LPIEVEEIPAPGGIASLAAPQLDQGVAQQIVDLTMHCTPDIAIEDTINRLADDLVAFCFERLEKDVSSGNIIDVHTDQEAFENELQVHDLK
jgi:hypothetical protein